jgi:hypothetical protein
MTNQPREGRQEIIQRSIREGEEGLAIWSLGNRLERVGVRVAGLHDV